MNNSSAGNPISSLNPIGPTHQKTTDSLGVSVVIPAYNYAEYLGAAITSVLHQDHSNFEIIVVDDGSTDNTAEVVAEFADERIRYVLQANAGLSAARNTGVRKARYEFIALLDADDQWLPTHLSSTLGHFLRQSESLGLVASTSRRVDSHGRELPIRFSPVQLDREIPVADIVLKTRFQPSAVIIRRSVFTKCGCFDTSLRSSEDRDMWIRIGSKYRIFLQVQPTVLLRKHAANMSKQADRMSESMSLVIHRAYSAGVVPRHHYSFWLKAWAVYFFQSAWMLHDEGRRPEAVRAALAALGAWPWPMPGAALGEPPFFRLRALARFVGLLPHHR